MFYDIHKRTKNNTKKEKYKKGKNKSKRLQRGGLQRGGLQRGGLQRGGLQRGGEVYIKVMTYNVLARGATDHQSDKHGFKLSTDNFHTNPEILKNDYYNEENRKKIKMFEHIEQTFRRYEMFKKEINEQNPDIVLLQEVDNYFYQYIKNNLSNYEVYFNLFIPESRGDLSANFATAVMWNKDLFNIVSEMTLDSVSAEKDDMILKDGNIDNTKLIKPEKGTLFGNKNATLTILEHKSTKKHIAVVSVHLPGDNTNQDKSTIEKQNLIKYVVKKLNDIVDSDMVKIIGGDFNCPMVKTCRIKETTECCSTVIKNILFEKGYVRDTASQDETISTCEFDYDLDRKPSLIDAIFYNNVSLKGDVVVQKINCIDSFPYATINGSQLYANINGASDHAWLMANFIIM